MDKKNKWQNVVVIGHQNPDTDSICAAIAYADLKNRTSDDLVYEARRAGSLNQESAYVLKRFGFKPPRLCTDVYPKVRNVEYRHIAGVLPDTSMRTAWGIMRDNGVDTLAVVNEKQELQGLITVQDIAVANMDVFDNTALAKSHTTYRNILETLSGTMIVDNGKDPSESVNPESHVVVGTASPDVLEEMLKEGDIVILANRYESQLCAIEMGVSLIIVTRGTPVAKTIQRMAEQKNVCIMSVPYDTYAAGKLISQCVPIGYCMQTNNIMKFTLLTTVDDAISVMAKVRFRYFPILDENGKYCGMLSRRNVLKMEKRKIILVDHNERTQAVEGFDQGEILEIVDHHRIGSLETNGPVYFRNQPLGSTCSIIALMYEEQQQEITPQIAGLLLSAILSDTLKFNSPTCTPVDKMLAEKLAKIAGVEIDSYAEEMFTAGENLRGKTAEDILNQDFKIFQCGDIRFGVGQGTYLTETNRLKAMKLVKPYLREACSEKNLDDIYMAYTDIQNRRSYCTCEGQQAAAVLQDAFGAEFGEDGSMILENVVSRKKQLIPKLMDAYQRL